MRSENKNQEGERENTKRTEGTKQTRRRMAPRHRPFHDYFSLSDLNMFCGEQNFPKILERRRNILLQLTSRLGLESNQMCVCFFLFECVWENLVQTSVLISNHNKTIRVHIVVVSFHQSFLLILKNNFKYALSDFDSCPSFTNTCIHRTHRARALARSLQPLCMSVLCIMRKLTYNGKFHYST